MSRCVLCHFRGLKSSFKKGSVLLRSIVFLFFFFFKFCFNNNSRENCAEILTQFASSPRLLICTGGLLRFSLSCWMLRIIAAIQEVRTSVPGATQRIQLWPGNIAPCLPVEMVGNCTLQFLPLWLFCGHARCLHPEHNNLFCLLDSASSGSSHRSTQHL